METATRPKLADARSFVEGIFARSANDGRSFHTMEHTADVVRHVAEIGAASGLAQEEIELVEIAAWFHDVGHTEMFDGHEQRSANIAADYLRGKGYPESSTAAVVACILATRVPQKPSSPMEAVLCDADMVHLGTKEYALHGDLLRNELAARLGRTYTDAEWLQHNAFFLSRHRYHTDFAREHYDRRRQKNVMRIRRELTAILAGHPRKIPSPGAELEPVAAAGPADGPPPALDSGKAKRPKHERSRAHLASQSPETEAKKQKTERGIETMFRTTSRNHLDLSAMADSKANIIIGVNAIVITIICAVLVRKLDTDESLVLPAVITVAFSLAVVIVATIATRPKINSGIFTPDDVRQKKVNLLFFGNFHRVPLEEYEWGMREMMANPDYLYGSMIKDIYFLGKVLARKYYYVRLAYNIFVVGLVISVISFTIALALPERVEQAKPRPSAGSNPSPSPVAR